MPRWARFLSCTLTGLLCSVVGFLVVADWVERKPNFWAEVVNFLGTTEFLSLILLFLCLTAMTMFVGRAGVNYYGIAGGPAGFLAGGLIAMAYGAFLVSTYAADWGGLTIALQKVWPAAALFVLPFAVSGAIANWLWDRLE